MTGIGKDKLVFAEYQTNDSRNLAATSAKPDLYTFTQASDEDTGHVMSFGELLTVLWRGLWIVILFALAAAGIAAGYSLSQTPKYEASTTLLIGQEQGADASSSNLSASDVQGLQGLTKTMAAAVGTTRLAEAVITDLNLSMAPRDLLENVNAEQIPDTQFVQITYLDTNPVRARQIVAAIGDEFSGEVAEISPNASAVTATTWERAAVSDAPVSPDLLRNILLGVIIGAILGVTLVFLLESLNDSWRSVEEIERVSRLPALGVIPMFSASGTGNEKRR